jgi:hypothetical protein
MKKKKKTDMLWGYARPVDPTRTTLTGKKQLDEKWEA